MTKLNNQIVFVCEKWRGFLNGVFMSLICFYSHISECRLADLSYHMCELNVSSLHFTESSIGNKSNFVDLIELIYWDRHESCGFKI